MKRRQAILALHQAARIAEDEGEMIKIMLEMRKRGYTFVKIARAFNITMSKVSKMIKPYL